MSRDISRSAEKRLATLAADAAEQFDSTILHNRVHEQVDGQHTTEDPLSAWLDATEAAYALSEREDVSPPDSSRAFGAGEALNDAADRLVSEAVAQACAVIVAEADSWTDQWGRQEIDAAQREARDWLQAHTAAAERAGVLDEVGV